MKQNPYLPPQSELILLSFEEYILSEVDNNTLEKVGDDGDLFG